MSEWPYFVQHGDQWIELRFRDAAPDPLPEGHAAAFWFGQILGEFSARNADFEKVAEQVCGVTISASCLGFRAVLARLCDTVASGGRIELRPGE